MKVALLSDCYLPRLGGIEVQVHDLAARLVARGHEVHVVTATPGAAGSGDEVVGGVPVHRLSIPLPWDLPVNPLAPPRLRELLRQEEFDVAHVHMGVASPFAVDCTRVTLALGLPTAMTWHCMLARVSPALRALGHARRWAARGVAMSAVSAVAAAPVQQVVGDAGQVNVLPNGIDLSVWRPPASAVGSADRPGGIQVVTAMRLATRKRPLPLLRTILHARRLVPREREMRLTVLGEGPDRGRVERFVREHDMSGWVDLPGRVPRDQLPARYAAAHLYISPGRLESFGIAALEARAVGLPVVALHGSGVGEFVTDGVDGLLARDDAQMAEAVARLVVDDELRERIMTHNREVAPVQGWDHVAALAEAEYAQAIALGR